MNRTKEVSSYDFIQTYCPPEEVKNILYKSCYDCHSNNTNYPWYSYVQPFGWIISRHVRNGKEALNLSEFKAYSSRRKRSKLKSMISQTEDGSMPMPSYLFAHRDAQLSMEDKLFLINWLRNLLKTEYENGN